MDSDALVGDLDGQAPSVVSGDCEISIQSGHAATASAARRPHGDDGVHTAGVGEDIWPENRSSQLQRVATAEVGAPHREGLGRRNVVDEVCMQYLLCVCRGRHCRCEGEHGIRQDGADFSETGRVFH